MKSGFNEHGEWEEEKLQHPIQSGSSEEDFDRDSSGEVRIADIDEDCKSDSNLPRMLVESA